MTSILKKINHPTFILIYAVVFFVILYKVLHVPITHDEVPTVVHYYKYSIWEIMMYPDNIPNNHILNTVLSKCSMYIFGKEQWALRLPNLLAFIVYGLGVYRILKSILKIESVYFIPAALLFIGNPYFLDFFGLSRGYGLSSAFCTLSISYLITGFRTFNNKNIWLALSFSMVACYANFTLLIFWVTITLFAFFYFFLLYKTEKKSFIKPVLQIALLCTLFAALIANPIYKMQSANQFQYWTSLGFFEETVLPLVIHGFYGSTHYLFQLFKTIAFLAIGILIFNTIYIFVKLKSSQFRIESLKHPVFVATVVLLLTAGINILQCAILNTPNLNGRTALFFYPLFITSFTATLGLLTSKRIAFLNINLAAILSGLSILHITEATKLTSVKEWWYDANTTKVLNYLEEQSVKDKPSLETNWLFNPSFGFYTQTGKAPWLDLNSYNKQIDINTSADYYYVLAEDYPVLKPKFAPIIKYENNCWLLKKKTESEIDQ